MLFGLLGLSLQKIASSQTGVYKKQDIYIYVDFQNIQNMGKNNSTFPNVTPFPKTWCEKVPLLTVNTPRAQIITWIITPLSIGL